MIMATSKRLTNVGIDKKAQLKFRDAQYKVLRKHGIKAAEAKKQANDLAEFYKHNFRIYK
jgi:hypothetical protein